MAAVSISVSTILVLCVLPLLSSASAQGDAAGDVGSNLYGSVAPVHLYETGQCPTEPKPICSDETCQGPRHVCPAQYRCQAATPLSLAGREVVLAGCRCCPLPLYVRCPNHDCRAPAGMRRCASEELEGCACETDEDRAERFRREFGDGDVPVPAAGGEEDLIEVNDDGLLDTGTVTQSLPETLTPAPTDRLHGTALMTWPTMVFSPPHDRSC